MQIAAWAPELSCRARRSDCRLQTANAVCRGPALAVFVREIRKENLQNTQGPGPSADPRLQMQIAARGGEGSCRAGASLQIPDCKYRLQHAAERGAAGLRTGLQIPDCKYRFAARGGEGSCGAEDRSADLRLQIQIAARDGEGRCRGTEARSADPRLQIQIAAHSREGGCRDRDEV